MSSLEQTVATLMNDVGALKAENAVISARIAAFEKGTTQKANAKSLDGIEPAPDSELDSKFGDPNVKFQSRFWTGDDFTGRRFSQTTPEFLRHHAKYLLGGVAYKLRDPAKAKYAEYDRKDAARALGWAIRLENGWQPSANDNDLSDILF